MHNAMLRVLLATVVSAKMSGHGGQGRGIGAFRDDDNAVVIANSTDCGANGDYVDCGEHGGCELCGKRLLDAVACSARRASRKHVDHGA